MIKVKKILFISFNDINNCNYGGSQCSIRNIKVIKEFGEVETYIIERKSKLINMQSALKGFFPPFSKCDKEKILQKLKETKFDYIFYDNSLLGNLIKDINRKYNIPSILFLHNVEKDYIDVRFGANIIKYPYKFLAYINERNAIKYANMIIALNNRDSRRIYDLYGKDTQMIIPITFDDKINKYELQEKYSNSYNDENKTCLFVGAFGNSNYEGIKWFVEKVAPNINIKVRIVGRGFEKVRDDLMRKNVEVIGFVEDIEDEYINASFVISPLLFGGGMKVKIAEALMYGKVILGTKEAFEGYELDYEKVGAMCNTEEEFINKINTYLKDGNKYNEYSRNIFEENYTDNSARYKFKQIFDMLDNEYNI